jgi:hypothetical protein
VRQVPCYRYVMSRKGPIPWKGKRQKVTLMIDSKAYRRVRDLVDQAPGLSVSDLVSELLPAFIDQVGPMVLEVAKAKNHTERLAVLERLYAEQTGQLALEFARTYHEVRSAMEGDEER